MSKQQGWAPSLVSVLKDNTFAICQGHEAAHPTPPGSAVLHARSTARHSCIGSWRSQVPAPRREQGGGSGWLSRTGHGISWEPSSVGRHDLLSDKSQAGRSRHGAPARFAYAQDCSWQRGQAPRCGLGSSGRVSLRGETEAGVCVLMSALHLVWQEGLSFLTMALTVQLLRVNLSQRSDRFGTSEALPGHKAASALI